MKVLLYFPDWGNRWAPYILDALTSRHDVTHVVDPQYAVGEIENDHDVLVSMWCDEVVAKWSHSQHGKPIITYLRRYELFQPWINDIDWDRIKKVVCVSSSIQSQLRYAYPQANSVLIPNGVSLGDFQLRDKPNGGKRLAMVASLRAEKNIPLAAQILLCLPKDYVLHHIGIPSALLPQIQGYFSYLGLSDRYIYEGQISSCAIPNWLMDKDHLLSLSISEGNPNNVIEAMAMGIRPVIHGWPGSLDQFPREYCFRTVQEAADMITVGNYQPEVYRAWVEKNYSLKNFERLNDIIESGRNQP